MVQSAEIEGRKVTRKSSAWLQALLVWHTGAIIRSNIWNDGYSVPPKKIFEY